MGLKDHLKSGNSFIDENHDWLLDNMDSLQDILHDNEIEDFRDSVREFISDLENHFSHEEIILKGAKFSDIESHVIQHRTVSLNIRIKNSEFFDLFGAKEFLEKTRSEIIRHELIEDQKYWLLFEDNDKKFPDLIVWSKDLETRDHETNLHHKSLVKYLNRLNLKFMRSHDMDFICKELKSILAYSDYHFGEEEKILNEKINDSHKMNHRFLISDLERLIAEVKAEKFEPNNI